MSSPTSQGVPRIPNPKRVSAEDAQKAEDVVPDVGAVSDRGGRYKVVETREGWVIQCVEAPGLTVHVDARHNYTETEARRLGPRAVFVDGAGHFAPLIDAEAQLYNLDHHEGCVRAFTLASCEQALVLVVKGIELGKGDWSIFANEPDLDTVLAIWVLLNHRRMQRLSEAAKRTLFPLLRLEGAIDAHGTEFAQYSGLGEHAMKHAQRRLDELVQLDRTLRGIEGLDAIQRCAELLRRTDAIVFTPDELRTYRPIEDVYGHVSLTGERVAVACRDSSGIYEVESRLRDVWDSRLGIVILENQPLRYTLRVPGVIGALELGPAYAVLNWVDPTVARSEGELWGGADEIGGSPRDRGSALSPAQLLQVIEWTYGRPRRAFANLLQLSMATLAVGLLGFVAGLWAWAGAPAGVPEVPIGLATFGLVLLAAASWLSYRRARRAPWAPTWQKPDGWSWSWLVPLALVFGAVGGTWLPASADLRPGALAISWASASCVAFGVEAWFRGWVQGRLMLDVDRCRPQATTATLTSAVLYAAFTATAVVIGVVPEPMLPIVFLPAWIVAGLAGLGLGLALGRIRERSRSLWPPVAIQVGVAAGLLASRVWMIG